MIKTTSSSEETYRLGAETASEIKAAAVVALYGDLGSGKTTFVRGFTSFFGVKGASSPSYILVKEYKIENKKYSFTKIYHLDLYRLSDYEEDKLGILDMINTEKAVILIEWAEKAQKILPDKRIDIYLDYVLENERSIRIEDSRDD